MARFLTFDIYLLSKQTPNIYESAVSDQGCLTESEGDLVIILPNRF